MWFSKQNGRSFMLGFYCFSAGLSIDEKPGSSNCMLRKAFFVWYLVILANNMPNIIAVVVAENYSKPLNFINRVSSDFGFNVSNSSGKSVFAICYITLNIELKIIKLCYIAH
jgi:hypothetical protein